MYDRLIEIQTLTRSKSATGSPVRTWELLKKKFAHVSSRSGGTSPAAEGERTRTDITFQIRWDPAINTRCRIVFESEIYSINHIAPVGRHDKMRIDCSHFENENENEG